MEPIQNKFLSSWQLYMLIIGQADKMLRDLRDSKGSNVNGDSGQWCESQCSEYCVFTVNISVWPKYKIQQCL